MGKTRVLTPQRKELLEELDKKLLREELTEEEWKEAIRRILTGKG